VRTKSSVIIIPRARLTSRASLHLFRARLAAFVDRHPRNPKFTGAANQSIDRRVARVVVVVASRRIASLARTGTGADGAEPHTPMMRARTLESMSAVVDVGVARPIHAIQSITTID
jgi:hypothetical protein